MRRREDPGTALETAWHIHQAQADWTGKVDTKAAFAFTVQSLFLTLSLAMLGRMCTALEWVIYGIGAGLLVVGAVLATSVVAPSLKRRGLKRDARRHYIYFGHARHWDPAHLERELRRRDQLPQLARQITVMADIAWSKHVRVAWSIWLGVFGGLCVLCASALNQLN
jgi:hypothetical protein